jgi:hypothetical protein
MRNRFGKLMCGWRSRDSGRASCFRHWGRVRWAAVLGRASQWPRSRARLSPGRASLPCSLALLPLNLESRPAPGTQTTYRLATQTYTTCLSPIIQQSPSATRSRQWAMTIMSRRVLHGLHGRTISLLLRCPPEMVGLRGRSSMWSCISSPTSFPQLTQKGTSTSA